MRKILSVIIALMLLFGLFSPIHSLSGVAFAKTEKSTAVFIAATFRRVGYDWDGKTLLDPPRDFPWQKPGQVCWGRPGYYMPDAVKARDTATGLPTRVEKAEDGTKPMYYTQVYLDVRAEGGLSTESNPYYVIVDSVGQLWFDSDGFFNDGRYDPRADPLAPRAPFEIHIQNARYVPGSCDINPRAIIDTSPDTNTKGPYYFNKFSEFYSTRQYFWDYKKDETSKASNRMWRIGWANLVDYPFKGAILPDGSVSDGIVKYDSIKKIGDWDYGLPIVPFTENEYHTEIIIDGAYTPGQMSSDPNQVRPHEFIYRALTVRTSPVVVEVGDMRLTPVTVRRDTQTKTYPKDTIVQDGDWDLGLSLINFLATEKHADNIVGNNQYDSGEWIYSLIDSTVTKVPVDAVRLTNVNEKRYVSAGRLALELGCGLYAGDALIMMEVFEGGCHTPTYDISVLTDVWMGQSPSYTAARLRSPNNDIPEASQRIQKATVLDPGLDPERHYLLPGTTFNNLHFEYREYLGVEIFFDNGVDNSIGLNDPNDIVAPLDLSDNYKEGRTCEQFIGAKDGINTLDLGRRLERIKLNYKYHNAGGEIPPRYGCGEAIYYVSDPNRYRISAGDKRFTDVDLVVGGVHISYKRNTVVSDGDADVGLELQDFEKERLYIPNLDNVSPQYSAPFDYDPSLDDIYYDANDNYVVDVDDVRLTDVEIDGFTYTCGSVVTAGDNYFLPAPINMITIGGNGNYRYIDSEVVPGNIGLKVNVDPPLKVEQTSTITVSVDPPPKEDEAVYVSIQSPQANEFNIFRDQAITYQQEFTDHDYNTKGIPMHWYDDDKAWIYELPFEFPFMGRFYNRVYVSSNGFLNFSSSYPMPLGLRDFDARLMVYGDDLNILPSTDPACITSPGNLPAGLVNYDPEDIYILKTNDSVTFRWRAQTKYETPPIGRPEDSGSYLAPNGKYYALIDASVTLFSDGAFKFSYLRDVQVDGPPGDRWDHVWKLYNRVNNVNRNSWVLDGLGGVEPTEPIVGITNGRGVWARSPFSGLKNMACVDGAYVVIGGVVYVYLDPWNRRYDQWSRFYADEKWTPEYMPFNEPSSLYPDYDEWKPYEDFRVLTADNPIATFTYTPYRGTCLETGIPEWVEIRAYKDIGGRKIAPPDNSYTFVPQYAFYDPTVWDSKWTKLEYWKYPWGMFQKTKYFIYPPITPMMPKELSGVYDCFGLERLQIESEELKLVPSKSCVNSLDERQPALWLDVYDADNQSDINDPQGMKVATFRRTIDAICSTGSIVQVDYGLTDSWNPPIIVSPVGATFLRIQSAFIDLFKVGDIVYIEPVPEYRRIVRIDRNLRRIYFDLPLIAPHGPGTQVVPNPIVGNYNIKGGGIKGMFTTIGGAGQRYIVQVRDDGSYDFWRWYEPLVIGQVRGALDPNDLLYSWQNIYSFDRSEACPAVIRTPFPYPNPRPAIGLEDIDCSLGQSICSICGDTTEFPKLGEWSSGDRYGLFGNASDGHAIFPNPCTFPYAFGSIWTWGVPVLILPNKTPVPVENIYDDGGKCIIAAWPQDPETPMNIRLYLNTALFDYNSKIKHPPHFVVDAGYGIDYCGEVRIRVSMPNPDLNFSEVAIIDHALQNSKLNYTMGDQAISPLPPPNPQIAARYYPLARNLNKDFRSYSGGQTNTGRVVSRLGLFNADNPSGNTWNAYPAIWEDQFVKLGTEFMPMTDYGLAFYLKAAENPYDKYSFFGVGTQRILKVEIEGPFAFPRTFTEDVTRGRPGQPDLYSFRLNPRYEYNEYGNVPLDYDFSGKLVIDGGNFFKYELTPGALTWYSDPFLCATLPTGPLDFRGTTNPFAPFDAVDYPLSEINPWLRLDNKWFYWGAFRFPNTIPYWYYQTVFLIDELIPVGGGPLKITVTMYNGTKVSYTDCCEEPPITEIPIHGIKIEDAPKTLEIEEDHNFSVTLTKGLNLEKTIPKQDTEYCNDAFLIVWQDRGIIEPTTKRIIGMGDGHIANPPRSSNWYKTGYQFSKHMDINLDGKISFADYETEVMGTYDLATNTWSSGIIDGRTFMREYGIYDISMSAENGSQLTTIGYDFGGIPDESGDFDKKQDHVISEYEVLPIYINAYKYADDNNDRGFTPLWRPVPPYEYSHEVYLAGMTKIAPVPHNDLVVSYTPDPLTAGVTPELVDPAKPLTFLVLDEDGNPVNLSKGVPDKNNRDKVLDRSIWNVLFKDPHPDNKEFFGLDARLPQYYWVRTDLQNNDATLYDNNSIYFSSMTPFDPISVDFSASHEGNYRFFNFCANDAGSFLVRVYSPDRRHYGETTVSVKLPSVSYRVINDEDPEGRVFDVPGSPDFVLTAVDKRVYTIEAQVFDAQGDILKGKIGAEACITEDGRFTPNTTLSANFRRQPFNRQPEESAVVYLLDRYYNLLGVDKNENGQIDPLNFERIRMAYFNVSGGIAYYNTQNAIDPLNGGFYIDPGGDIPDEYETWAAWGLGCIYNSPYKNGYCLADLDRNSLLTFNDSLDLDQEGKVRFKFYANDRGLIESYLGGFVGKNRLTSVPAWADVAGHPFGFRGDPFAPFDTWRRFRFSGARFYPNFALDWDAHPDTFISIKGPELRLLDAKTRQSLGKELLNPELYDLHYGVPNHIVIQALPADSRDLPIKEDGEAVILGATHEMYVRGKLKNGPDGVPETTLTYSPTGTGYAIGYINYIRMKGGYNEFDDNLNVGLARYTYFDSSLGLALDVSALGELYPRKKVTLRIKVYEGAAKTLINGASVRATGAGVNEGGRTNSSGICELDILPTEEGEIIITATKEKYLPGSEVIYVGRDTRPLFLYLDPTPELTRDDFVIFAGYTKATASLSINGENVSLDAKGNFSVKLPLSEGENKFTISATSDSQKKEEVRLIIRDSLPPEIEVFDTGTLVDVKEVLLKGKISERDSSVTVNGKPASVIGLEWQITIPVEYGKNTLTIITKDKVGNEKTISKELYVFRKLVVEVQLGNKTVFLNGVPQAPLSTPPYLKDGRMMLPLRIISEVLGGKAEWNPDTKEVKVTFDDKVVSMVIGSNIAIVNGEAVSLDTPPEIREGTTFVPLRFISDAFGFEVEWIESTKTAKITRLI